MLASAEDITKWSFGSVESPDTINYRTGKPKQKGLFCEAIFGPMKNYECSCGKYKWVRYKWIVCERCGVEVTTSRVRRTRMWHIELAAPVVHVRYVKANPSRIWLLLDLSINEIEKVLYYVKYIVTDVDEEKKKIAIETLTKEYRMKVDELDSIYDTEKKKLKESEEEKTKKAKSVQEEQLRKVYSNNKDDLEKEYSRIKSILANLEIWSTILESDYRNFFYKYDGIFDFASWSQAILNLLKQVNIEEDIKSSLKLFASLKGEKRKKQFKKLKLLINLYISGVQPEWMVLSHLPVIPPDLRPVVQLEWGKFASSDVNLFYRRVLMRNLRLKRMIQVGMPDVVKKNEIRLLQEAVNNLLVWEKGNTSRFGAWVKVFKSLTDMLSGKEGIFRKNLLGKRVDYSWRSVITVGPNLKLDECGLPLYVAVKMFTPFIIGKLIERKISHTPKQAEKLIKDQDPIALKILEEVIDGKYVLLNRAPTLHRLSIQAFKVKLVPGKTIRIHPLVCPAFNADFDGDQMAVHVPLSEEAQREAEQFISAAQNVLKPASGDPVITHSQDLVIGAYYLTDEHSPVHEHTLHDIQVSFRDTWSWNHVSGIFADGNAVLHRYKSDALHIKDRVVVNVAGEHVLTTVWRIVFNQILPENIPFINEKVTKKGLKKILDQVFDLYGKQQTVIVADLLKDQGFKFATLSAVTMNVFDLHVPEEKDELLQSTGDLVNEIHNYRFKWFLSDDEKHRLIVSLWSDVKAKIEGLVKTSYEWGTDIFSLIDSWARWTWGQMTQMAGMKWLVASPSGKIIELPIKSSLLEWFSPIEYFISAHGARKGKADTALRTAESGYMTRRLVDASQEVIVREEECGVLAYLIVSKEEAKERRESFESLIFGRVLAEDVAGSDGIVLARAWDLIDKSNLALVADHVDYVKVRSPLTCCTISGVCQKCFGMDLSVRKLVEIGSPIGIISSQSIGEPGTQLTMRTFHSGWVASAEGDMTQGIKRVEQLFEARKPKKPAVIAPFDGTIHIHESPKKLEVELVSEPQPKTYIIKEWYTCEVKVWMILDKWWVYAVKGRSKLKVKEEGKVLEVNSEYIVFGVIERITKKVSVWVNLRIKDGADIFKWQVLSTGSLDLKEYMDIVGALETQRYVVKEIKKVYTSQGQDVSDKYMEVIVKQLFSKVLIEDAWNSSFVPGTIVKYEEFMRTNMLLEENKKQPAKAQRLVMWLTQIAKQSESWMSAASFQETVRVMTEASVKWAIDELSDLKANVIIGRLLPVGNVYKQQYFGKKEKTILDAIEM